MSPSELIFFVILFFNLFMHCVLSAPLAVFFELQFAFDPANVFMRKVVNTLTNATSKSN